VLLLCLLLPALPARVIDVAVQPASGESVLTAGAPALGIGPSSLARRSPPWPAVIAGLLALGIAVRAALLMIGLASLRRLRARGEEALLDERVRELCWNLAPDGEIRWHDDIQQPVTFGVRHPIILLPARVREMSIDLQRAVVCHELVHIARRDWDWVIAEELVRAAFWFHPAVWWALNQLQLAREETVDALSAPIVGRRRYVEALLAFAYQPSLSFTPPFVRRTQLAARITELAQEADMSRVRIWFAAAALAVIVFGSTWGIVSALPLRTMVRSHVDKSSGASSSEAFVANVSTPPISSLDQQLPPPPPPPPPPDDFNRIIRRVNPLYPAEASGRGIEAAVTVRLTIAQTGDVVDVKTVKWRLAFEKDIEDPNYWASKPQEPFVVAAEDAARQWKFSPTDQQVSVSVLFTFRERRDGAPVPATAMAAARILDGGAPAPTVVRVGGGIKAPQKVRDVQPMYPDDARAAHVAGVVVLEARIATDGAIADAKILRSIPMLDEAALQAVKQWRYTPTLLNGDPVEVLMTVTVNFPGQ
jgi:TonB family protein